MKYKLFLLVTLANCQGIWSPSMTYKSFFQAKSGEVSVKLQHFVSEETFRNYFNLIDTNNQGFVELDDIKFFFENIIKPTWVFKFLFGK